MHTSHYTLHTSYLLIHTSHYTIHITHYMLLFSWSPGHILQEFTLTSQWLWPGSLVSQAGTRKFWSASSRTWTGPSKLSSVANANKSQLRPDPVCLKACHRQAQLWACLDTAKRQVIILSYHSWYCCCHWKDGYWNKVDVHPWHMSEF